jgi:hypothetical protein
LQQDPDPLTQLLRTPFECGSDGAVLHGQVELRSNLRECLAQ